MAETPKTDWKSREIISLWERDGKLSGKLNLKNITGQNREVRIVLFSKRADASEKAPDWLGYVSELPPTPATGPTGPASTSGQAGSGPTGPSKPKPPTKPVPVVTGPTGPATTGPAKKAAPRIQAEDPAETCSDQPDGDVPF